jgi:hypothetical protein
MKLGIRKPSPGKMIAARLSPARVVRHRMGLKMPRGFGWLNNPRRALYNRIYYRASVGLIELLKRCFK